MSSSDGSSLSADEIELGLGLSLGGGGGRIKQFSVTAGWDHRPFLTTKDLPSAVPDRGPLSADPASLCPLRAVSGTKRAADSASQEAASPPSPAVSQVVGWPPLRTYRINNLVVNQAKPLTLNEDDKLLTGGKSYKLEDTFSKKKAHNCRSNISSASSADDKNGRLGFVKVNVDGLPIGRKVDLNAHASYETLALALEDMFFTPTNSINSTRKITTKSSSFGSGGKEQARKPLKLLDGLFEFVLTYKDTEGDWMLVGDVPWEMFLGTVRRLRIMRTSEANGLGSRML